MGESRGRWEGNTLVIETTNYKPGASATNIGVMGSPAGNRFPTSEKMKTTERLTRLNNGHDAVRDHHGGSRGGHAPVDRAVPVAQLTPPTSGGSTRATKGNRAIPDYVHAPHARSARRLLPGR